jgi:hypothetical protein
MSFNHTFRYIDDVHPVNNENFHNYVHLIYPDELEIKDTAESYKPASYLHADILLDNYSNGRLTTTLHVYHKRDDFGFAIANFPFLCTCVVIYHFHLLRKCMQWLRYQRIISLEAQVGVTSQINK